MRAVVVGISLFAAGVGILLTFAATGGLYGVYAAAWDVSRPWLAHTRDQATQALTLLPLFPLAFGVLTAIQPRLPTKRPDGTAVGVGASAIGLIAAHGILNAAAQAKWILNKRVSNEASEVLPDAMHTTAVLWIVVLVAWFFANWLDTHPMSTWRRSLVVALLIAGVGAVIYGCVNGAISIRASRDADTALTHLLEALRWFAWGSVGLFVALAVSLTAKVPLKWLVVGLVVTALVFGLSVQAGPPPRVS